MDFKLYQELNNFSLNTLLTDTEETTCMNRKKLERLAIKDIEWPEIHTIVTAGYIHNPDQFGFDGYDQNAKVYCEAKSSSKIVNKELIQKYIDGTISKRNEFINGPLDGRGVFSQFTHKAFEKYITNNVKMLVSGYVNGVLMFIIEFPFNYSGFSDYIKRMLDKSFPNGDKPGRSKTISFSYNHYKHCPDVRLVYITRDINKKILKGTCTKNFYSYIELLQTDNYQNKLIVPCGNSLRKNIVNHC